MSTPQRSQAKESQQTERRRLDQARAPQPENLPPLAIQHALADPGAARPAALLSLQRTHGNRAVHHLIQRQSAEEEEELLQMKPAGPTPAEVIQRQSPEEEELLQLKPAGPTPAEVIQRQSWEEEELMMKADEDAQKGGALAPEIADEIQRQRGSGPTLEASVQAQMGSALGADFSQVHVHADAQADRLSRALNAKAFTIGHDVFFREGLYHPNTSSGRELLAHELTHVVQQTGGGSSPAAPQAKLTLGPVGDQYEQEAERVAQSLTTPGAKHARPDKIQRASVIQRVRLKLKDLLKLKRRRAAPQPQPQQPQAQPPQTQQAQPPQAQQPQAQQPQAQQPQTTATTATTPQPQPQTQPTQPATATATTTNTATQPQPQAHQQNQNQPQPPQQQQQQPRYGSASAATQRAEAIGGDWRFGLATGLVGGASGLAYLGSGIAGEFGEQEGDINEANRVSAGLGIAGGGLGALSGLASTVGSSMELAGKASELRRGLALRREDGLAGRQLGQRMRRRGGIGVAQKSLGVLGGLTAVGGGVSSIGAGARTLISGKADDTAASDFSTASNAFSVAGGGLTMLSEGLNIGTGIASLRSAFRRSKAAAQMKAQLSAAGAGQDTEMADIASFVSQHQNKSGKGLGMAASASNWISGALGTAGGAAGLGGASLPSTVLYGLSTGFGLLGTALSAHAGRKSAAKAEANKAAADAAANQLVNKLKDGNANAINFARDVLGIQGDLKQMAEDDKMSLKELIVQKMMKYG